MVGLGEGGVDRFGVAVFMDETDIVGTVVPHQLRTRLQRGGGVGDRRENLVIHLDQFRRILCLGEGFGDHEGDVIADPAHPALYQRGMARPIQG